MNNIETIPHLNEQAARKNIGLNIVRSVLANPAITYKSFTKKNGVRTPDCCNKCGIQKEKWCGEAFGRKVCIVVAVCCRKAITVWEDQVETEVRPDQRAKGVTGYTGRDGRWRS